MLLLAARVNQKLKTIVVLLLLLLSVLGLQGLEALQHRGSPIIVGTLGQVTRQLGGTLQPVGDGRGCLLVSGTRCELLDQVAHDRQSLAHDRCFGGALSHGGGGLEVVRNERSYAGQIALVHLLEMGSKRQMQAVQLRCQQSTIRHLAVDVNVRA